MKHGSVTDCDPKYQKGATFVARGAFNSRTLCWHQKDQGFFWTLEDGRSITGSTRLAKSYVEQHASK